MNLVVDSSAIVAALVDNGPDGTWAEQILEVGNICVPHLMPVEAANILRRAALAGDIGDETAALAHHELVSLRLELFSYEALADRVWELRSNVTAYDACYVALAELLECELVTLDRKLARAAGPHCRFRVPPAYRVTELPTTD